MPRKGSVVVENLHVGAEDTDGMRALTVGRQFRRVTEMGLRPVSEGYFGEGEAWLLLTDGDNNLYVMREGDPVNIGKAPDSVTCAVAFDEGWCVMTESARFTVRRSDGLWHVERDSFAEPEIHFTAISHGTFNQTIAGFTLKDVEFSRLGTEIPDAGIRTVTSSLLDAYTALTSRVSDAGLRMQPVLARAELLDRSGRVVYTSLPQLVTGAGGWQCCSSLSAQCTKPSATELAVPEMMLSAEAYGVGVSVESLGSFAQAASTLRVTLTPQDHPVDFAADALCRVVHPATNTPALTVALPGTTASWADMTAGRAERLRGIFDRFDYLKAYTATVEARVGDCGEMHFPPSLPATAEVSVIGKALARGVSAAAADVSLREACAQGFIAGCVAECGDTVVWGDITQIRGRAAVAYGSLAENAEIEWSGTLRLTRTDGSVTDRLLGYPDRCPLSLGALTAYPDPDVKRIDVWVNNIDTATIGHAGCDLRPSADGTCALAVTPDLQPIEFEAVTDYPETVSTGATQGRRIRGAVLTAYSAQPLMPVAALEITPSRISALAPAVRAQTLDAARTKLYAFTQAGIFNITLPVSRGSIAATLIDRRGAAEGCRATFTPEGVYFTDASGTLRRISGSKTVRIPLKTTVTATARDAATGRLLLLDAEGNVVALSADTGAHYKVGLPSEPLCLTDVAGTPYLTAQSGLYTLDDAGAGTVRVKYVGRVKLPRPSRVVGLEAEMAVSGFRGEIALATDGGSGAESGADVVSFELDTAINGPLFARIEAPSLRFATVRIEGEAAADFRLTELSLIVCRPSKRRYR